MVFSLSKRPRGSAGPTYRWGDLLGAGPCREGGLWAGRQEEGLLRADPFRAASHVEEGHGAGLHLRGGEGHGEAHHAGVDLQGQRDHTGKRRTEKASHRVARGGGLTAYLAHRLRQGVLWGAGLWAASHPFPEAPVLLGEARVAPCPL